MGTKTLLVGTDRQFLEQLPQQIADLLREFRREVEQVRNDGSRTPEWKASRLASLRAAYRARLQSWLDHVSELAPALGDLDPGYPVPADAARLQYLGLLAQLLMSSGRPVSEALAQADEDLLQALYVIKPILRIRGEWTPALEAQIRARRLQVDRDFQALEDERQRLRKQYQIALNNLHRALAAIEELMDRQVSIVQPSGKLITIG